MSFQKGFKLKTKVENEFHYMEVHYMDYSMDVC